MNVPNWFWWLAGALGLYGLYEYFSAECQLPSSPFYGSAFCTSVFPWAASSFISTAAPSPLQAPAVTLAGVQAQLAGYGLPPDAIPSAIPAGSNCGLAKPVQSGFNPTPGAPFYSRSTAKYYCGPANLWQAMGGNNPANSAVLTQTNIPESSQAAPVLVGTVTSGGGTAAGAQ